MMHISMLDSSTDLLADLVLAVQLLHTAMAKSSPAIWFANVRK